MDEALKLYGIAEVAARLRCSERHVHELVKTGRLKACRRMPGAAWRIASGDLCRFLDLPSPGSAHAPADLLTLLELRRLSGFGDRCLRAELAAGRLPGRRVGRRWLVTVTDYTKWANIRLPVSNTKNAV